MFLQLPKFLRRVLGWFSTPAVLICVEFGSFLMETHLSFLNWGFICRCSPYLRWVASRSTTSTPTRSPWPCSHLSRLSGPPSCGCRNFRSGWRKILVQQTVSLHCNRFHFDRDFLLGHGPTLTVVRISIISCRFEIQLQKFHSAWLSVDAMEFRATGLFCGRCTQIYPPILQ